MAISTLYNGSSRIGLLYSASPLGNEFIALLKDSSLVSVIGFEELTRRGQLIIAKTYGSLEIWISVAVIYLAMTLTISRFVAYLERRYKTDDRH